MSHGSTLKYTPPKDEISDQCSTSQIYAGYQIEETIAGLKNYVPTQSLSNEITLKREFTVSTILTLGTREL